MCACGVGCGWVGGGGGNVYIYNPGHITRMAVMPICGKTLSKIFYRFQPNLMACSISLAYYIFVHVMSLTYFTTRSKLAAYAFEWGKLLKGHLKGKSCIGQNIYDSEKWTHHPRQYIQCMYITIIFKHLF